MSTKCVIKSFLWEIVGVPEIYMNDKPPHHMIAVKDKNNNGIGTVLWFIDKFTMITPNGRTDVHQIKIGVVSRFREDDLTDFIKMVIKEEFHDKISELKPELKFAAVDISLAPEKIMKLDLDKIRADPEIKFAGNNQWIEFAIRNGDIDVSVSIKGDRVLMKFLPLTDDLSVDPKFVGSLLNEMFDFLTRNTTVEKKK